MMPGNTRGWTLKRRALWCSEQTVQQKTNRLTALKRTGKVEKAG